MGLGPNAHKLMEKSSYDFSKQPSLGHVPEANPYGLNDTKNGTEIGWQSCDSQDWTWLYNISIDEHSRI